MEEFKDSSSTAEGTSSQSTGDNSSPSSATSSRLSSTKNQRKNKKNASGKEVQMEDEIFFQDELDSSRVAHDDSVETCSGRRPDADLELTIRRRKIIQDILALFDLDEVMDRYRGDSISRSLNKRRYRHLLALTMTESSSPHSDRAWNDEFRRKVLAEFERKQVVREKKLAEAESERMLKLQLQGLIRDEEEEQRMAELVTRKTAAEKRFERRIAKNHQSLFKPNDIETQMEILNRGGSETHRRHESHNGDCGSSDDGDGEVSANGGKTSAPPTYKSQLGRTNEDTKEVHPQLKEFYEEEDLGQLYREAENLVRRTANKK